MEKFSVNEVIEIEKSLVICDPMYFKQQRIKDYVENPKHSPEPILFDDARQGAGMIIPLDKGEYETEMVFYDYGDDCRVGEVLIYLGTESLHNTITFHIGYVAVDSGQLNFSDLETTYKHHDFSESLLLDYDDEEFCSYVIGGKRGIQICSGFGDGVYPVIAHLKDNNVVGCSIRFIEDDEDDLDI